MSSDLAIQVSGVSKCYRLYEKPSDRLMQAIESRALKVFGRQPDPRYKEFWALRDVSFEVKKGESVGIVGRNGSGKSTLLQIITGTLSSSAGSVMTSGRIASLLELGAGFNPEFSGRENVFLNASLLGLSDRQIEERFDSIAAFADIGSHIDQPVKTYSSGMFVRLAFAVQVHVEPDILIVDEALAVGDWLFQKRCFQKIEKLVSDGMSLLFVSHEQETVRTMTNRALLLDHGVMRAWGTSSDVVLEYRRLLHDEEAAYFTELTKNGAANLPDSRAEASRTSEEPLKAVQGISVEEASSALSRSTSLSFGDGEVQVVSVQINNGDGSPCSVFYPGDLISIRVRCKVNADINHLNVGIRLRNKEGIKLYSWGTLNQDMAVRWRASHAPLFWDREFRAGEEFEVELSCPCRLGVNLYEVQASVTYEAKPDYSAQRVLHWVDDAAFFQVLIKMDEYFFGGVTDLAMNAKW